MGLAGLPPVVPIGDRLIDRFTVPARWAFCAPMVRSTHSQVIEDARDVPSLAANPFVSALGLRGYIGVPLFGEGGGVIGSHCQLSPTPIAAGLTDILALETGAADAIAVLDRYRVARGEGAAARPLTRR